MGSGLGWGVDLAVAPVPGPVHFSSITLPLHSWVGRRCLDSWDLLASGT